MHGSDEEIDDPPEVDSDEDLSDDGHEQNQEEVQKEILLFEKLSCIILQTLRPLSVFTLVQQNTVFPLQYWCIG